MFLGISQDRSESAERRYKEALRSQCLIRGAAGGVAGALLLGGAYQLPHGYLIGPIFGASVGVLTAWDAMRRQSTGKVQFDLDGKTYSKSFYGHPSKVALTAEEVEAQILAGGAQPSSRVNPFDGKVPELPAEALADWKDYAPQMGKLAAQRRLVASFEEKTANGQDAVHLLDGLAAARLAAQGGKVYLVNAQEPKDQQRWLTMVGFNVARSESLAEEYRYLERGVDYQLVPLKTPADLALAQPEGRGVPEGMAGLLENATHYREVVKCGNQKAEAETDSPEFGTRPIRHSDRSSYYQSSRADGDELRFEAGVTTRHHLNFPALLGLAGTAVGMAVAMANTGPGVPGPALIGAVTGFLTGRALGRAIIERG